MASTAPSCAASWPRFQANRSSSGSTKRVAPIRPGNWRGPTHSSAWLRSKSNPGPSPERVRPHHERKNVQLSPSLRAAFLDGYAERRAHSLDSSRSSILSLWQTARRSASPSARTRVGTARGRMSTGSNPQSIQRSQMPAPMRSTPETISILRWWRARKRTTVSWRALASTERITRGSPNPRAKTTNVSTCRWSLRRRRR